MKHTNFTSLNEAKILIETERLRIYQNPLTEKVLNDLYEIYSSESNVQNYCIKPPDFIRWSNFQKIKIDQFQEDFKTMISYVIELKENSKIIGVRHLLLDVQTTELPFEYISNKDGNIITEIIINEEYWRQGYAYEASSAIFNLLKEYSIKYALSFIPKTNIKSQKLDLKLGFVEFPLDFTITEFNYFKNCVYNAQPIDEIKVFVKGLDVNFPFN